MDFIKSGKWLSRQLPHAVKHFPEKLDLLQQVFKNCVILLLIIKKRKSYKVKKNTRAKYKWSGFLDIVEKSNDDLKITQYLFYVLLNELKHQEKPFWNSNYKKISVDLRLPNNICEKSSTNLNKLSINKYELEKIQINDLNPVDLTDNKPAEFKTIKIKIYPNLKQKAILDEFINTSRYVYNLTIEKIKQGHKANFQTLRDLLVTSQTKKKHTEYQIKKQEIDMLHQEIKLTANKNQKTNLEQIIKVKNIELRNSIKQFSYIKNPNIKDWELNTSKRIRANAVKQACDAWKSAHTNLKRGNIRYFNIGYRKKTDVKQTIELSPEELSMENGIVKILPQTFLRDCILKIAKKNTVKHKNLVINHNTDLVRHKGEYYLHILAKTALQNTSIGKKVCGIDPGIRTFATVYGCSTITEYRHDKDKLGRLNNKIDLLKQRRIKNYFKIRKRRIRKRCFDRLERYKYNMIDQLHWDFVNDLLKYNDVIYYGDIKSHDIVKDGKNKILNRNFNDLKFYKLKQRLAYKAGLQGKHVSYIKENYTIKTCSACGVLNQYVGCSDTFHCKSCLMTTGRDWNAAKNIKMKGFLQQS